MRCIVRIVLIGRRVIRCSSGRNLKSLWILEQLQHLDRSLYCRAYVCSHVETQ